MGDAARVNRWRCSLCGDAYSSYLMVADDGTDDLLLVACDDAPECATRLVDTGQRVLPVGLVEVKGCLVCADCSREQSGVWARAVRHLSHDARTTADVPDADDLPPA